MSLFCDSKARQVQVILFKFELTAGTNEQYPQFGEIFEKAMSILDGELGFPREGVTSHPLIYCKESFV